MLATSRAFSGFSTDDIPAAKAFYADTLGFEVSEEHGMLTLLRYDGMPQDGRGVMRGEGPPIAWFADPAGNICSVIEEEV